MIDRYIELFFKITIHPKVVVAHKIGNLYAHVRKLGQFAQGSGKTFGDDSFVFEPKIKKVAHEKNGMSIVFDAIQPGHKLFFPGQTVLPGRSPKVIITGEVNFFVFGK